MTTQDYFDGLRTQKHDDDLLTEAYALLMMIDFVIAPFRVFFSFCANCISWFLGMRQS